MTTSRPPICVYCTRFRDRSMTDGSAPLTCSAFPDGIPQSIITNETDHRNPVKGDDGRQFVPESPQGERYAESVFDE